MAEQASMGLEVENTADRARLEAAMQDIRSYWEFVERKYNVKIKLGVHSARIEMMIVPAEEAKPTETPTNEQPTTE